MKKKKGFTLIELLAVIVILAIIALIATPLVLGVIEKSKKGAFSDTAYGIISAAEYYYVNNATEEEQGKEISINVQDQKLQYKGTKPNGNVMINPEGKIKLSISNSKWCAVKEYEENEVKLLNNGVDGCVTISDETGSGNGSSEQGPAITVAELKNQVVTSGSGLYYLENQQQYFYKGSNVKNYINFNNELWRIMSINPDGNMKIIRQRKSSNIIGNIYDITQRNLFIYLNGEYYNEIEESSRNNIVTYPYLAGELSLDYVNYSSSYSADNIYTFEKVASTQLMNVSLMTLSDFMNGTTNRECSSTKNAYLCAVDTWLLDDNFNYEWLLDWGWGSSSVQEFTLYLTNAGELNIGSRNVNGNSGPNSRYRPVVTLKADIKLTGSGTELNPYKIKA